MFRQISRIRLAHKLKLVREHKSPPSQAERSPKATETSRKHTNTKTRTYFKIFSQLIIVLGGGVWE